MTTMKRKVIAGAPGYGPFNVPFTMQEREVLGAIDDLRVRITTLKGKLSQLPKHACAPPENYDPADMESFGEIERALTELESTLRWIPGGAYRFAEGADRREDVLGEMLTSLASKKTTHRDVPLSDRVAAAISDDD